MALSSILRWRIATRRRRSRQTLDGGKTTADYGLRLRMQNQLGVAVRTRYSDFIECGVFEAGSGPPRFCAYSSIGKRLTNGVLDHHLPNPSHLPGRTNTIARKSMA